MGLVGRHLSCDSPDQRLALFQPLAALLELLDGQVLLILHLGDGVGGPEQVRDLVELGLERPPDLAEDHHHTGPFLGCCVL